MTEYKTHAQAPASQETLSEMTEGHQARGAPAAACMSATGQPLGSRVPAPHSQTAELLGLIRTAMSIFCFKGFLL